MRAKVQVTLIAVLLSACGGQKLSHTASVAASTTLLSVPAYTVHPGLSDVLFFHQDNTEQRDARLAPTDCRAHISDVICNIDKLPNTNGGQVNCKPDDGTYAKPLQALYDHYPPALQRMFCSLSVIYLTDDSGGTAFAGLTYDKDHHITGAELGIRRSVIDQSLSLTTWATWKEELSFGGITGSYIATAGLPYIETSTKPAVSDFLYFTISHEFGHMFDFVNGLNQFVAMPAGPGAPVNPPAAVPGSWSSFSWATDKAVTSAGKFPYRKGLCFYSCDGEPMSKAAAPEVYRGLYASNFISTYAASNPWDDLADSFAYYRMDKELGTSYTLHTGQGEAYDIMQKLGSDVFAAKRQFITDFFGRPTITYP